ncbi:heparinase II/III-family protein [Roseomonas sp. OT10]|uniref:heparinase II/III domain-containing protein n=1 Tax=Roseomonas cutis TaxID=2897332 RepID=UPI001E3BCB3F|nr:heparinase II/III family protein [Roseomonas sp. OT10]UFN50499.1 heparinase II/III-family protein [Roseomonas sp. OT10]
MLPQAHRLLLLTETVCRLGPSPVFRLARHRASLRLGWAARSLADAAIPAGSFLAAHHPGRAPADPGPLGVVAAGLAAPDCHGGFDPAAPALSLDLFAAGDVRPVWEANRWAELPLLAQAHRLEPEGGHLARAEAWLRRWCQANPPFRGPNWACGQEAALRLLHLALAWRLLGGAPPSSGLRALVALHRRRIAATRAYAAAQDNNHAVSEPAGLLAGALLLGEDPAPAAGEVAAALRRLVAPDGGFAQLSTGYHRLLLDVLSVVEWLRRETGAAPFPAPFADRAAAATRWLARLAAPGSGALPRLGHQDGSRLADLSLAGEASARGSLERAARLFLGASAGWPEDPGCDWLGLPPGPPLAREARWTAAGSTGWSLEDARALLRTGPLRFRPGHSDLLHLDLWDGPVNLIRDGGTLSYNPAPASRALAAWMEDAAGHNAVLFDGAEPMARIGRFLRARWSPSGPLPAGGWRRDRAGNRHEREIGAEGRRWVVTDRLSGRFRQASLCWRLAPAAWDTVPGGVVSPLARITLASDAALEVTLGEAPEADRYGQWRMVPALHARVAGPAGRIVTSIDLPRRTPPPVVA